MDRPLKGLLFLSLALLNLAGYVFVYLLHAGRLGTTGIEGIAESSATYLLAPILLVPLAFARGGWARSSRVFFALLSLSLVIYAMSAHTGSREAVSVLQHPQYLISLLGSIGILTLDQAN